jgi:hypothetical protein
LQGEGVFGFVVAEEAVVIAIEQRAGGDHFGVEEGVLGEQAQEETAVAVSPIHHRRHAEAAGGLRADLASDYGHFRVFEIHWYWSFIQQFLPIFPCFSKSIAKM